LAIASYAGAVALFWSIDLGEQGLQFRAEAPRPAVAAASESAAEAPAPDHKFRELRLLNRTIGYVRNNYVDPDRVDPRRMLAGALSQLESAVPEVLVKLLGEDSVRPTGAVVSVEGRSQTFDFSRVADLYQLSWELKAVMGYLDRELPAAVPRSDVELAVANGMLQTLDPHSILLPPEVFTDMQVGTTGKFGGLGIVISNRKGELTVMSVLDKTPAARAGVQSGDIITQINDESTVNMSLDEAVNRLRGEVDTPVSIALRRKNWPEPRSFKLRREEIKIESVASRDLGKGIGYVRIKNFQQNTRDDLGQALERLKEAGALSRGLVLDLRDNPGGLLDQAIDVSDLFLESGTIVATVGNNGQRMREEKKARRAGTLTDLPVVVLVNSGSASASEIVTGALKNNDRAVVLGSQTFGKGSVQVLYEMTMDDERVAALKLTVAQYLTPGDQSIQSVGIAPDILTYPVSLEPKELDLYVSEKDLLGESELDNHLASERDDERAKAIAAAELLRYYEPQSSAAETAEDDEPVAEEDNKDDYLIRFGRDLLRAAGTPSREATLQNARKFLEKEAARQEAAIRVRLAELGIQWPDRAAPAAGARIELSVATNQPDNKVMPGDTLTVTATARNVGNIAVGRLRAETESKNLWLDNRELIFGALPPGESRSWSFEVKMPKGAPPRKDPVVVQLYDDQQILDGARSELSVAVALRPQPQFAFSWVLDDSRGNGDGLLQRGEEATLKVRILNDGEGAAEKVRASLKNESGRGVFLSKGQVRLEAGLAPGGEANLDYDFKVQDYLDGEEAGFSLVIVDTELRMQVTYPVKIPVRDPLPAPSQAETAWYGVRAGTVLLAAPVEQAAQVARAERDGAVRVLDRREGWLKAEGPHGWPVWIREINTQGPVRLASREPSAGENAPIDPAPQQIIWMERPPRIQVDSLRQPLQTSAPAFQLKGRALFGTDAENTDVYVFRNKEKVFFRAQPAGAGAELSFDTPIELEAGENAITVFARQGRDRVEQLTFFVHKL
jgi:carboxyl-terminal processing protease